MNDQEIKATAKRVYKMIPLLSRARSRLADILDSRRLARTVLVLSRQLDHAHLAGQIEEARADRAEERVAELELQLADWREASGELVAEQAAADLPDLEPADDSGPPSPLPADPYARAEVQARRADAAERHRLAAEAHAADLESELATVRAQLQQTERSAGAHLATIERLGQEQNARDNHFAATIERLQAQIKEARRAGHVPTVELQIPAVLAAESTPYAQWSAEYDARHAADEPAPETQPSERITATTGAQS